MQKTITMRLTFAVFLWAVIITSTLSGCPFPKKPLENGIMVYQAARDALKRMAPSDYLLRFRCSPGYTLKGTRAILCSSNQWTHKIPKCIRMECNDPPEIENGRHELLTGVHDGLALGSTANYTCDAGYQLDNTTNSTLTCIMSNTSNAEWSGKLPKCQKLESCPDPGNSRDGTRDGKCCFIGDVLRYTCNDAFELEGKEEIQCLSGGNWSAPRPLCRPFDDHCDPLPPIPHGFAKGEKEGDFFRPYDEVEVVCEPGFRYSGLSELIMCEEESEWDEEFHECVEAFCDTPQSLNNGTIQEIAAANITSFPYNFQLTYVCDEGFRLVGGESWRFCDTNGWSGKTPHCEVIKCPNPGVPEYGFRVGSSFEIRAKVTFECFSGYQLIGSVERYCLPNGQWSGELARCDIAYNYCPDPGIPINGVKSSSNYDMGEKLHFRCQAGFTLLGSETRECLPNRTWSGEKVECLGPNDFDNTAKVGELLNIKVAEKRDEQKRKLEEYNASRMASGYGRAINTKDPGRLIFYFAFDVSGSVGESNFQKSVEFAKAIVWKVGITENGARAGALTFSSKAVNQFYPFEFKSTKEVLEALDGMNYTGGGTSANSAIAMIREELIPLTQGVFLTKEQKYIIFILTDGKANMGGHPQEEAELLKEKGIEIYCVGITNTVFEDSLYKIASSPKKEHVFILRDYPSLAYLIQKLMKGDVDYSECGLGQEEIMQISLARIVGGKKSTKPWPWIAAIHVTRDRQTKMICGGSIIHEYFILTAAHCLYDEKGNLQEPKNLIVKLGLTDTDNETSVQEFEVKTVLKHPQNKFKQLDYDVALLKLERPIEFNALVRPICLPSSDLAVNTTFYKPGEIAAAIGWGHTEVMNEHENNQKMVKDLHEILLPIQSRQRCKDSILDHKENQYVLTENMFCAGDGRGGNDTCKGDSGGPLMQSQLSNDGFIYWTQVGIISWGPGCGLPNQFGFYTHVQRMSSWIKETIKNEGKDD